MKLTSIRGEFGNDLTVSTLDSDWSTAYLQQANVDSVQLSRWKKNSDGGQVRKLSIKTTDGKRTVFFMYRT